MRLIKDKRRLYVEPEAGDMLLAEMIYSILTKKCTTYKIVKHGRNTVFKADKEFYIKDKSYYTANTRLILHSRQIDEVIKVFEENGIKYTIDENTSKYKPILIDNKLKTGMDFRDDLQREYNEYLLVNRDTYLCTMQTGKGKTGSTIISLMKRAEVSRFMLLIPPKFHLIWEDAFKKFTNITSKNILLVSGRDALYNLVNIKPITSVVIISPPTLREYFKDYFNGVKTPIKPSDIMKYVGSEYIILDEAHNDFANLYINVLALNPKKVIMLTASYESGKDDRKVTKFKDIIIPEKDRMPQQELDKYVNVVFCQFRFDNIQTLKYTNPVMKWYSHAILESSICKSSNRYKNYFDMLIYFVSKYHDGRHRILYLFTTKDMVRSFYMYLKKTNTYGKKKLAMYIEGDKDKSNLRADVIISTDKSCGTGVDIEDVQVTMNTISTESEYFGVQSSGRNRKMENTEQYYLTLWATNIEAHNRYKKSNSKLFAERAKEVIGDYYAEKGV
jgi:hypothetical protein